MSASQWCANIGLQLSGGWVIHTRLDMRNLLAFCEYANLVFELENYVLKFLIAVFCGFSSRVDRHKVKIIFTPKPG